MKLFTEKSAVTAAIFAFAALILAMTFQLRTDVGMVPRSVAILLMICSGVQLLTDLFPRLAERLSFLAGSGEGSLGGEGMVQEDGVGEFLHRWLFFGWIALFIGMVYLTSMMIAAPAALFIYLRFISQESWRMSLLYPLVMAVFIYLVFVLGFRLHYFM